MFIVNTGFVSTGCPRVMVVKIRFLNSGVFKLLSIAPFETAQGLTARFIFQSSASTISSASSHIYSFLAPVDVRCPTPSGTVELKIWYNSVPTNIPSTSYGSQLVSGFTYSQDEFGTLCLSTGASPSCEVVHS